MKRLVQLYDSSIAALAVMSGLTIMLAMTLVVIDVGGRFFASAPIAWVNEWTEHLMVFIPFLGMAWLVRRAEGHIRIDLVANALSPRAQNWLGIWVTVLCVGTCAFASYYAGIEAWKNYVRGINTIGIYPVPKWPLIGVVSLAMGLCAIEFSRVLYAHIRKVPSR